MARFDADHLALAGEPFPVADPEPGGVGGFVVSANGVLAFSAPSQSARPVWFDRVGKQVGTLGARG